MPPPQRKRHVEIAQEERKKCARKRTIKGRVKERCVEYAEDEEPHGPRGGVVASPYRPANLASAHKKSTTRDNAWSAMMGEP